MSEDNILTQENERKLNNNEEESKNDFKDRLMKRIMNEKIERKEKETKIFEELFFSQSDEKNRNKMINFIDTLFDKNN
jgi:hypothetical protein